MLFWQTHPDNAKLKANYINVDPINSDSHHSYCWKLSVVINRVPGLHLKSWEGLSTMAILGHGVTAVAHEGVILAIKGAVEITHDPAGARLQGNSGWFTSAKT